MSEEKKPAIEGELVPVEAALDAKPLRPAGRMRGYSHTERARSRIKTGRILYLLHEYLEGRHEMTLGQVQAARILLAKTVPDMRTVEHSGAVEHRHISSMSDAELEAIAAGRRAGTLEAPSGALEPAPVH